MPTAERRAREREKATIAEPTPSDAPIEEEPLDEKVEPTDDDSEEEVLPTELDDLPPSAEAEEIEEAPTELGAYVMLVGPSSYGPVKLNGRLTRLIAGSPILVTDPVEREALLSLYCFRPAIPRDFLPPYSGPITTDVIRGGGLKDPQQI